jgi:hypothetical protein
MPFMKWLALILLLSIPAHAEDTGDNEALVMRLIFEDCLGYVRDEKLPFQGLETFPLSTKVEASLSEEALAIPNRLHLLSGRYIAIWGISGTSRSCSIGVVDDPFEYPEILTVRADGFIARVTERANRLGLTDAPWQDTYNVGIAYSWSEPGRSFSELRIFVMPYSQPLDDSPVDTELISVSVGLDRPTS